MVEQREIKLSDYLWSFCRQTEVEYVDRYTKNEEHRRLLYAVVDAVLEIREKNILHADHIQAFMNAVECTNERVFSTGASKLVQCTQFSTLAEEAIRKLAQSPHLRVRYNVMACLEGLPKQLALELLPVGLRDKSAKVACKAAEACDDVYYPETLVLREERLQIEKRPKVLDAINWFIGLMRTEPVIKGKEEHREYNGGVFVRTARHIKFKNVEPKNSKETK